MVWYPVEETKVCVRENGAGFEYEEIGCLYPWYGKSFMTWEWKYDLVPLRDYMVANPWIPIAACVLYGVFIVVGRAYFSKRDPWSWRNTLALWNLSLSVFSAIGFIRAGAQLVHNLSNYTMHDIFCNDPENAYGSGVTGVWVQFFCLSKFPELIDTFFIVIHKKPLIFLHWYHHITVLLYCWHSYVTKSPSGIFFCTMNYAVHSIMYGYYFLMAIKKKPKWLNAKVITIAQISQMIVGVAVTAIAYYYYKKDPECYVDSENNLAAFIMYGSYLFLFLQFFIGRYYGGAKPTGITSTKKQKNA